jgi:hypothetical protein
VGPAEETERSPVISQVSPGAIKCAGLEYIVAVAYTASRATLPLAPNLAPGTAALLVTQGLRTAPAAFRRTVSWRGVVYRRDPALQ